MENQVNGKICPSCSKDIGVLAIIKAGFPSKVKCPHCNSKVIYKPFPWLFASLLTLIFFGVLVITIPITYSAFENLGGLAPIARLIVIALLWLPFEIILAKYLRQKSNLELKI